tara:strand:+ start:280 stop:1050 length:771 start_codon:yes stop_codon:yes gene_type:complete
MANFVLEEKKSFNTSDVKTNDIIFVDGDFIETFFEKFHDHISQKYILITHNSTKTIDHEFEKLIDNKIIHWFAENLTIRNNSKFSPLPLGLENKKYLKNGETSSYKREDLKKDRLVLCSFATQTNKEERQGLYDIAMGNENIDVNLFNNHKKYIENLSVYKFNLCPSGAGLDTHRFWESLMVKTIPIVKSNYLIENLVSHKFPMLVVEDWSELNQFDIKFYNTFYNEKENQFKNAAYKNFDYWKNIILSKKIESKH